jgi:uncharacterized membrane protein YuzA (DUF378 family)
MKTHSISKVNVTKTNKYNMVCTVCGSMSVNATYWVYELEGISKLHMTSKDCEESERIVSMINARRWLDK